MARGRGHEGVTGMRPRFVSGGAFAPGETVTLASDEVRHVRVRRLADGVDVEVLDGHGHTGRGPLGGGGTTVLVESVESNVGELAARWTVALAVSEAPRVEWAVEKGTECGAATFLFWIASRSQPSWVRSLQARLPRLSKVAVEAVKQCGRSVVPVVEGPLPFGDLVARKPSLVAVLGAPRWTPGNGFRADAGGLIVIGPEGGLTHEERAALEAAGAIPFGLGPRVLRLETAVVASLLTVSIG
jgi:16S rRNA (uracil1498-N3)-methyltransferase